jgi:hypothetical protein
MDITKLCNKALAHLGEAKISDFHENSVVAGKCRLHYEMERDALLRMHRWNFARARAVLTALATAPVFGWAYQFQLPVDCLRLLELNGREVGGNDDEYEIEGRKLLTDAETASIVYTKRVEDPNEYDVLFCEAFTYKLAAALCKEIENSTSEKGAMLQMFQRVMAEAGWVDAVETRPRVISPKRNSRMLAARRGPIA